MGHINRLGNGKTHYVGDVILLDGLAPECKQKYVLNVWTNHSQLGCLCLQTVRMGRSISFHTLLYFVVLVKFMAQYISTCP